MRNARRFFVPFFAGLLGLTVAASVSSPAALGGEVRGEVPDGGARVIVVGPQVLLRSENKTLGVIDEPTVDVVEVRNGLMLVRSGGCNGWVRAEEVTAASDAEKLFSDRLRQDPNDAEARARRGSARRLRGDRDGAMADFDAALNADPQCAAALLERGDMALASDDPTAAERDFNELVRVKPRSAVALVRRGMVRLSGGEFVAAGDDAERAQAVAPSYADAYVLHGRAARGLGKWQIAERDFDVAAELEPTNPVPHRELALLWAACPDAAFRDGRRALEAAERACNLTNWEEYESLAAFAAAQAECGDFSAAVESQRRAVAAAPASRRGELQKALAELQAQRPIRLQAGKPGPAAETSAAWTSFVSREHAFRVLFPGKPEVKNVDSKLGPGLRATLEDATLRLGFFVEATPISTDMKKDRKELIAFLRSTGLPKEAKERSFREIEIPGATAIETEWENPAGVAMRTRFIVAADHIYMTGVAGKIQDFDRQSAVVARFLDSFALLRPESKPPAEIAADRMFTSEEGRFRAEFPAPPKSETHESGARRHHVWRTDVQGVTYFVDYADFTADELRQAGAPEKLLQRMRNKVAGDAPVRLETPRGIGDNPGLELVLEPEPGERSLFNLHVVGLRGYVVAVIGTTENLMKQQAVAERFFESFQVRTVAEPETETFSVVSAEPRYGRLGPRRSDWTYLPFDVLNARLQVVGFRTDAEGRLDVEATVEFIAPDGGTVSKKSSQLRDRPTVKSLPLDVSQEIPPQPGDYRLKVTLRDRSSGRQIAWEQAVVVRPVTMAIVAPAFFRDADAKVPAAAVGNVGEALYLEIRVIGFDRSRDQIDTALSLQLIDETGKPMLAEPVKSTFKTDAADTVRRNQVVTYITKVPLPRPGQTTVRVTVLDLLGGDAAKLELPLKIVAP